MVMAVPPRPAAALLPGLKTPSKFRAIVNAHFRFDPPAGSPKIVGVIGGSVEWLFAFPGRLSVTVSGADRLVEMPREQLARRSGSDVAQARLGPELPPWQIVASAARRSRRPGAGAKRPGASTAWRNLVLAGDWTDTGLPATIEGAIRSGNSAAEIRQATAALSST